MKTLVLLGVMALAMPLAQADSFYIDLNREFSGAQQPNSPTQPWVRATFEDVTGGVQLTIAALNLINSEFISGFYFNFNPAKNAATDLFNSQSYVSGEQFGAGSWGNDCCKADGDGFFDALYSYSNGQFTGGETSVYKFTGMALSDFLFSSAPGGGNGTYYAAAHVQGIGTSAAGSGWIGGDTVRRPTGGEVPEPSSVFLFGTMAAGIIHLINRKRQAA